MRIVLVLLLVVLLCCAGYGVAFQHPPAAEPSFAGPGTPALRSPPVRVPHPESYSPGRTLSRTTPAPAPVVLDESAMHPSQMAVLISKSGLRFLSPRAGFDIDE